MDIRACPMAAVKCPVWYFLDEVLQLILKLLWSTRAPITGNDCFSFANHNNWPGGEP
jgi:hypothetical protein